MNERIKQLWNKAAESTAAYPSGQNNSWETQVNFIDKFAELIVLETLDQVNKNMELTWVEGEVKIKQHFGVNE